MKIQHIHCPKGESPTLDAGESGQYYVLGTTGCFYGIFPKADRLNVPLHPTPVTFENMGFHYPQVEDLDEIIVVTDYKNRMGMVGRIIKNYNREVI